ncbi:MAG TPA: beta-N-acetylhexosaminidase [Rhizorhapis sp.]|nr:beta-N-acetylhexosaminidase [Rhizorhapis sp.]
MSLRDLRRHVGQLAIIGFPGYTVPADVKKLIAAFDLGGVIYFARNVAEPAQVRDLSREVAALSREWPLWISVDQEGGRVARLKPPHWRERPPAARFGTLYAENPEAAREAAYLNARLIAHDLASLGINVDCLPVLDVPVPGAHDIIGDRAFATDPATIIALGRAQIEGLMDGGVLPVMKHIPGHGRAESDSHLALPRVSAGAEALSASDFVTFRSLDQCPIAMTAHVIYESIDPQRPCTTSPKVIRDVIRGEIGFDGLLMSDDLSMKALDGPLSVRARQAQFAGCDLVLHCNGDMEEMRDVAAEVKILEGLALKRSQQALAHLSAPGLFDPQAAEARLAALLEPSSGETSA